MSINNSPIGIFDSGVGGTSIWKEIIKKLPEENTIYLSDSKNAPYGEKSKADIIALAKKNTDYLIAKGAKVIVVACNTATTNGIKILRDSYNIPFIGIEPAIKPASLHTQTNVIGILATKGTLSSELFEKTSSSIRETKTIKEVVGKGLVELIEKGKGESEEMHSLLQSYLHPLLQDNIDCLVLGCTHYPYLIPQIKKIVGKNVQIIDSGEAVARQTKAILTKNNLLNFKNSAVKHEFFINTNKTVLEQLVKNNGANIVVTEQDF
ncbi:MAG: glutamate racemase [Flavobacteriaceae bacterium]|nr:glutamate racemase [Flavobacteriaceae bacterium]